ncbi:hypothetical protein WME99_38415 [Sorangium sp. So ce136]
MANVGQPDLAARDREVAPRVERPAVDSAEDRHVDDRDPEELGQIQGEGEGRGTWLVQHTEARLQPDPEDRAEHVPVEQRVAEGEQRVEAILRRPARATARAQRVASVRVHERGERAEVRARRCPPGP